MDTAALTAEFHENSLATHTSLIPSPKQQRQSAAGSMASVAVASAARLMAQVLGPPPPALGTPWYPKRLPGGHK